jgi:nicotinate dehydrogenase subunit B
MSFTIVVNGVPARVEQRDGQSLLDVLRDQLGLTGPKFGCGEGACGACTVLVGRRGVTACTTDAAAAAGQRVTTVEGLAEDGILHPVQQAWLETGAMQCGYCTPGWLTATAALLARVPHPDDARIAAELAGNMCRCCTYPRIRRAVHRAAELMEHPEMLAPVPPSAMPALSGGPGPSGGPAVAGGPATAVGDAVGAPWDRAAKDADTFFGMLPDGLVTVVHADAGAGAGPGPGAPVAPDDAWVHVGADGTVTAFTGKVEAGQGTRTALALLVAEELAVPAAAVRLVMGNTDISPFDIGTFGSRSMPYAAPPLRAAAAAACALLRDAAAERLGISAGDLTVANGIVAGPDGAPSVSYADLLAGQRLVRRVPADGPVTAPAAWRTAGHAARALAAPDVVVGAKRFPADLRADGMLQGAVLRAPAFGARLRGADTAAAQALPGVTVVREGAFIGVAAPDAAVARRAVALIDASWDRSPQPATADLEAHLRSHPTEGEGFSMPFLHVQGDAGAALAAGPVRIAAHYRAAYIAHVPLEPRSALASWRDGRVTVWTGTSTPFRARRELAEALDLPEQDVQVIVPDYGGGFGGKHGGAVAIEAARLARVAGRPVQVQWNRDEEFHGGYLRPAALIDVACSADASGAITGWSFTNINSGAAGVLGPYRIPHQRVSYQPAQSPLPQGAYRALASTANHFARESMLDELAHRLGVDPLDMRLRHLDDERMVAVLRAAAGALGWDDAGRPEAPGDSRTGNGIAVGTEKAGRVATAAQVRVDDDGTLQVLRIVTAFDCGAVVNPENLANQVEGAVMMGLGGALFEAIDFADGRILNASLSEYRVPRLADLPELEVMLLDRPDQPSAGGGEAPVVAVAPAIANAIFHASGVRLRSMPLVPSGKVREAPPASSPPPPAEPDG